MKLAIVLVLAIVLLLALAAPALAGDPRATAEQKLLTRPFVSFPEASGSFRVVVPVNALGNGEWNKLNPQPEVPSSNFFGAFPPNPVFPHIG